MAKRTCSTTDCDEPCIARGLCNRHYYAAKREGTLEQIAPKRARSCAFCETPLPPTIRYGSRFCSRLCGERADNRDRMRDRERKKLGRVCIQCHRQIPTTRNLRARTCSPECQVRWNNAQKKRAREAQRPPRPPCASCGEPIPDSRRYGARYCSTACKKRDGARRQRERSPGYMRQRLHGITPEQFAMLLAEQAGQCAICRTDTPGGRGGWHVDHDHESGVIRGLLCHNCNVGLGNFKDDATLLRAAVEYLAR